MWGWADDPTISPRVVRYTAGVLLRLGYRVRVHWCRTRTSKRLIDFVATCVRNYQFHPYSCISADELRIR